MTESTREKPGDRHDCGCGVCANRLAIVRTLRDAVKRQGVDHDDRRRLRVENAALRAGLPVDEPAVKLALQTFEGDATPAAMLEHYVATTASVLSQHRNGRTWSEFASEVEPDEPTAGELDEQRRRAGLYEVES